MFQGLLCTNKIRRNVYSIVLGLQSYTESTILIGCEPRPFGVRIMDALFVIILFILTVICSLVAMVCNEALRQLYPKPEVKKIKKKRPPIITFEACVNYALAFAVCWGLVIIEITKLVKVQNG